MLGSGLAVDDTITWTKGEVLGRGAYGTVRMPTQNDKVKLITHSSIKTS